MWLFARVEKRESNLVRRVGGILLGWHGFDLLGGGGWGCGNGPMLMVEVDRWQDLGNGPTCSVGFHQFCSHMWELFD